MESHASEPTQTNASALHKRRDGKENNVPPSPVSHTGNAQPRRPLAALDGAHDAAAAQPQQTSEVSADERAKLLEQLQLLSAAQPTVLDDDEAPSARRAPPAHALASIWAQPLREISVETSDDASKLSERAERLRKRVLDKGGDPDEDVFASAPSKAGTRFRNRVGPDAYAPKEQPSRPERPLYPKKPEDWVHYVHDDQIDHDREALQKIPVGDGRTALDALIDGANKVGRLFFNKFEIMVAEKVCNPMRLGALTKTSTTTLSGKVLGIDLYVRKREEGTHVAVYRAMAKVLRDDLGVVAGESGRVEGPLSPFAVAGNYHGHDGHVTKMTEASSLFHKGLIQGATTGRIDPIIKEGVNCNFARRTMESAEYGGIANDKRGNFGSNARDGAPLVLAQIDPRQQRFGMRTWLQKGALSQEAFAIIGVTGTDTNAAAHASGVVKVCIVSLAGYDAAALSLAGIVNERAKPAKTAELRYSRFQDTLAVCSEKQPHLLAVYEALLRLGVAEEPNSSRNAYKCLKRPVDAMRKWASATSALTRAFSVCLGDGAEILATTKDFKNILKWEKDWSCTRDLLDHAGVDDVSELVHVSGDASGGAVIGQCSPHYVPLDTTMLDAHGERVHKPKRPRLGTGNGPTRFKCHRCGHAWNPELSAINQGAQKGQTQCPCGAWAKPEA